MSKYIRLYILFSIALLFLTSLVSFSAWFLITKEKQKTIELAKKEARITFDKDQSFREWATEHGGVYVRVTEKTSPNPYLAHIPNRDIALSPNHTLTLMNPAYMMRQVMRDYSVTYGTKGHITSSKPMNPINKADEWEERSLKLLETGIKKEIFEIIDQEGVFSLRLIRPMFTHKGCLKCHGIQGYELGDIRGGVSVSVSMTPYLALENQTIQQILFSHTLFYFFGIVTLFFFLFWEKSAITKEIIIKKDLQLSNAHLKVALNEIKTLRGIIPICSYCKKIRDEKGVWHKMEAYIHSHSDAKFSHSICPKCYEKEVG